MAENEDSAVPANPLVIPESPSDTLDRCAAVIAFLSATSDMDSDAMGTEAKHGLYCLLETVQSALKYESGRAMQARA